MKTRYSLILLLGIIVNNLNAQWINSMSMSPANPKTTDTIYVYADCSFPSGSCDEHTQFAVINGTQVTAGATHCIGGFTFICDATDTFKINPLPAGNYNFIFSVVYGPYPAPCSPVFNPGATDSISFIVSDATSMYEIDKGLFQFTLFPNPVKDKLQLTCNDLSMEFKNVSLFIHALTGQQLLQSEIKNIETPIDVSSLPAGIYLCRILGEKINEKHLIEVRR